MPIQMRQLLWSHFDELERRSLLGWTQRYAPGVKNNPGPRGCYEGKNGPISRICGGYGIHAAFRDIALRHDLREGIQWLINALVHYPDGFRKIMAVEKHPPGEYTDIGHTKDDDSDILRHENAGPLYMLLSDPAFLGWTFEDGTQVGELLSRDPAILAAMRDAAIEHGNWLFGVNWTKTRNWHIRHHYPIYNAVGLYRFLRNPLYVLAAGWLLQAFWSNPRYVGGIGGRGFRTYDSSTPGEGGHHWDGTSVYTCYPWYQGLDAAPLFEMYLCPVTPLAVRDLCVEIVVNLTDWYLFREECPLGDLAADGDQDFINCPIQGSLRVEDPNNPPSPFLTAENMKFVIEDDEWDDMADDEYYWPFLPMKALEVDGRYHAPDCEGKRRYHHPQRYAGGPGKQGILGPQVELSSPAKSVANLLALRSAIEIKRDPELSRRAMLRAKRIAIEQCLYMHRSFQPVRKKDLLGVLRMPETGWFGLAPGNNRMPYWTLEGYRILRNIDHVEHGPAGEKAPGVDLSSIQ